MEYCIANESDYLEIILMKDRVKQRIINQGLPIWLDGYPANILIHEDLKNGFGRIVKYKGKIIAYATFMKDTSMYETQIFRKDNLYCFGRLMVDDDYLSKHVGKFLVDKMILEAKSLKANGMGITVDSCNVVALNLYKSFGFIYEGEKTFPYAHLDIYGLYF